MRVRPARSILLVTDLWDEQPYGIFTVISNLKREFETRGIVVDVLEPSQFFTIPLPLYKGVRLALFARGSVRRKIEEGNYDDIHIVTEGPLGWWTRSACIHLGIPFTTAFHAQLDLYVSNWLGEFLVPLIRRLIVWFHSGATHTLVSTQALKEQLRALGLERVSVYSLGVKEEFFTEKGRCPAELDKPVFMFFGRVSSEKGVEEFLSADVQGSKLVIGDGPDREKLEIRFPEVKFVGFQDGAALIAWCACADVMVMPSRTETFGLTMVESLALGIPIAAHDVTGPREIVKNGVNGYLDENLARAAQRCLTLSRDACRESVQKYKWSNSAETFLSILSAARRN